MRVKLWAIAIAVVIDAAIGALWYSSLLFGDTWHALQGLDAAALGQRGWVHGLSMLVNVIKMATLGMLISRCGVRSWRGGAAVGLLAWAGFVVTIWTGATLYADRSLSVLAINMSFHLIVFTTVGSLMGFATRPTA